MVLFQWRTGREPRAKNFPPALRVQKFGDEESPPGQVDQRRNDVADCLTGRRRPRPVGPAQARTALSSVVLTVTLH